MFPLAPPAACVRRLCVAPLALALVLAACGEARPPPHVAGGEPQRGREAIERFGCVACHTIPGVSGHRANVGPPLVHLAGRGYIAGVLPNTPDNLVRWLRNPPAVDPRTAMPNLGLSQSEAADIAAYLYERGQ